MEKTPLAAFFDNAPYVIPIFLLVQLPLLYLVTYQAYILPVQKLNQSIARFMTGIDDEPNISQGVWSE